MLKWGCLILRHISTTTPKNNRIRGTFKAAFGKYLLLTNTVSSGALMLIGDLVEQKCVSDERFDYARLTRMFITGLTMGPVHHYYYRYINILWPARDFKAISKKILADQFVMSPLCIVQFFYTLGVLEKKSLPQMNKEIVEKFSSVYLMDWCLWPPAQFINFYFVPWKYQVFYINSVTMLYNVFLSYIKHVC